MPKRYSNINKDRKGILVMMKVKVFPTTWLKCKLFLIAPVKGMPSLLRERERERASRVGLNEGHFTLITIVSSYVNSEWV
jgi:hypothetical protein